MNAPLAQRMRDAIAADPTVWDRFWAKVSGQDHLDCWLWTGAPDSNGYGRLHVGGVQYLTHRLAYELMFAPIPDGLQIDHLCRVRLCVNPWHLEPVTSRVNTIRGEAGSAVARRQLAKTHCKQGHPFDEANTYLTGRTGKTERACRTCRTIWGRERRQRQGVAA